MVKKVSYVSRPFETEEEQTRIISSIFDAIDLLVFEPTIFNVAENIASNYNSLMWDYRKIEEFNSEENVTESMYIRPQNDITYIVQTVMGNEVELSRDAFGLVCTIHTINKFSWAYAEKNRVKAIRYTNHYHALCRHYIDGEHPEAARIHAALD